MTTSGTDANNGHALIADTREIERTLRLFVPPDSLGEIRIIGGGAPRGIYFGHDEIPRAAQLAAQQQAKGVYVIMNRVAAALASRPRLSATYDLTTDQDIDQRAYLLIDFDPARPTDASATDAEKEAARQVMEGVYDWLRERLFPEAVFADSGNGWHLLFRVDLPADTDLPKRFLHAISRRFSTDTVGIDISVHNASRIVKLYGTVSRKGENTPERPHRISRLLSVPDCDDAVVSAERLEAVINELTTVPANQPQANEQNGHAPQNDGFKLPTVAGDGSRHETLKSLAGYIRAIGADRDEILGTLRVFNQSRCAGGGKPDAELQSLADYFSDKEASAPMAALLDGKTTSRPKPRVFTFGELRQEFPRQREPIIDGLARPGEVVNIVSKSKTGKSWTAYGLLFSVVAGIHWLGKFFCRSGKVLLIDNELKPETLAYRLSAVQRALDIPDELCLDRFQVICLRGQVRNVFELSEVLNETLRDEYAVIILDALYKAYPPGMSENDNAMMTEVYSTLDRYAAQTDAVLAVIHHSTKGEQGGKDVADVGAGAGAQSRSADTHLILRPHEEQDCVVLDAAVRSFPPLDPLVRRWDFPRWRAAEGLDPSALKASKLAKSNEARNGRLAAKCRRVMEFLSRAEIRTTGATKSVIRDRTGINQGIGEILDTLADDGEIIACKICNEQNKKSYDGWILAGGIGQPDKSTGQLSDTPVRHPGGGGVSDTPKGGCPSDTPSLPGMVGVGQSEKCPIPLSETSHLQADGKRKSRTWRAST